ncbi:MAG: type II toxin-antitoxin system VapB family antitoxin [Desulfobacteraceae bacterium]|nr:MAG: type II toxin-antitoxin system VapB family antitoxin [Desulfobacteraceae bacterium]
MRITVDIPDNLIRNAMKASHIHTKKQVIITALENLIRKSGSSELIRYKGKIDINIDIDAIRNRKINLL